MIKFYNNWLWPLLNIAGLILCGIVWQKYGFGSRELFGIVLLLGINWCTGSILEQDKDGFFGRGDVYFAVAVFAILLLTILAAAVW